MQCYLTHLSARCTQRPVRRHCYSVDVAGVAVVVCLQLTVGEVPHLHRQRISWRCANRFQMSPTIAVYILSPR